MAMETERMSREEEVMLCLCVQGKRHDVDPAEASRRLVAAHHRLIRQLAGRIHASFLDPDDALQEARLAFLRTLVGFDPAKGARLATYAHHSIVNTLYQAMDRHSRSIRLSFGAQKALRQVTATVRQLEAREGRAPSDEEIARELDWTEERVAWLRALPQEAIPFEASTSASDDNEGLPLIDVLPSDDPPIDEAVTDALLCDRALSVLCERERDLLLRRYGLAPYEDRQTCREIARAVCCSPQRVALIERRALRRIRKALGVPATGADR